MNAFTQTPLCKRDEMRVVGFRLGNTNFAANVEDIEAICWASPIIPTPDLPTFMEGELYVGNLRVPVMNLRRRLGMARRPLDEEARILILRTKKGPMGLLVDAMDEVFRLPSEAVGAPSEEHPNYIQGVVPASDLLLLDFEKLADCKESSLTN